MKNIILIFIVILVVSTFIREDFGRVYHSRPNKCFDCERAIPGVYGTSSKCFSCEKAIGYHGGNTKCFRCMSKDKVVKPRPCVMCERNMIVNKV